MESPDIDIVDISTPNYTHAEIAVAAANAGKHILCEANCCYGRGSSRNGGSC